MENKRHFENVDIDPRDVMGEIIERSEVLKPKEKVGHQRESRRQQILGMRARS